MKKPERKSKKKETVSALYQRLTISLSSAVRTGLEPVTSCVTGRHSNQLNYRT